MTLGEYVDAMWLPWVKDKVRPHTYEGYAKELRLYVKPSLSGVRLDKLDAYRLDVWMASLKTFESRRKDDDGKTLPISANTALHAYRTLHNALRRAVKWRLIPANPLDAVDPPRIERGLPDVLTPDEVNAYLDAFAGHALEPVVLIALGAGLRRSELAALSWDDIGESTVSVTRGYHDRAGRRFFEPPKTSRSRRVVNLPEWCTVRLDVLRAEGPLVTYNGERMSPSMLSDAYARRVRSREGLRYVPMKQLRHTHATVLLNLGADLKAVSDRLGHSTTVITSTTYIGQRNAADEGAARMLDTLRQREPSASSGQQDSTNDDTQSHNDGRESDKD